jgi:hypothetical protein
VDERETPPLTSGNDQNGNVRARAGTRREAQSVVARMDSTTTFTRCGDIADRTWFRVLVEAPNRVVAHWGEIARVRRISIRSI